MICPYIFGGKKSTGWSKKSLWCDLEEKCLRNSKIFFDGVFLSIYSHLENGLFKKSQPIKKETYFLFLFFFI